MKNFRYLISIIILVCLGLSNVAVAKAPVCPSQNFNVFIKRFAQNTEIQKQFTKTPLRWVEYYDEQYNPKPKVSYLALDALSFPILLNEQEQKDNGITVTAKRKSKRQYVVSTETLHSGAYTYELTFRKNKRCWYLTQVINAST
jgi:hypothetical protein